MKFVTIASCVRWCVCVFDPIYSGPSLRLSVYVRRISRGLKRRKRTQCYDVFSFLKPNQWLSRRPTRRWRTSILDTDHYHPNCCLVCTTNRLSLASSTRLPLYFYFYFCRRNVPHFFAFISPLLGKESQKCVQHVVLALWCSGPVGPFYNHPEVSSPGVFLFLFLKKECSFS